MTDDITIKRAIDNHLYTIIHGVIIQNKLIAEMERIKIYDKVSKEQDVKLSVVVRVARQLKEEYEIKLAVLQQ